MNIEDVKIPEDADFIAIAEGESHEFITNEDGSVTEVAK
jgi:hypothetical protein